MNLEDFRKSSRQVKQASKLFSSPVWAAVKKTLHEEHPMFKPFVRTSGIGNDNVSYQLGAIDGFNRAIQLMETMALPQKEGFTLKETYEHPEE